MTQKPITLRVTDTTTYIEGSLDRSIYQSLKKVLGFVDEKAIWKSKVVEQKISEKSGKNFKFNNKWDGVQTVVCYNKKFCRCSIKKDGIHFPTGMFYQAREFLRECEVPLTFIDARSPKVSSSEYSMSSEFEARDYQAEVIDKSYQRERGIIKAATGSGKTSIAAAIIAKLGAVPACFYVPSIDLLRQSRNELQRFITKNGSPIKVGAVGGGECDIQDITVMTVQTACRALGEKFAKYDEEDESDKQKLDDNNKKKIVDFIRGSKQIFADEVQHWASKTCQIISDNSISARYRFGMSATPVRDEGDDMLIDACFGRTIADISASFLIKQGFLVKPTIYFVHNRKNNLEGSYSSVYEEGIVNNDERNTLIANITNKMIEANRNILVLVRLIEHGKKLESMIPGSFFMYGEHSGKERAEHIAKMKSGEAKITISSSLFDEGIDVRPLDCLILAGSGKSSTRALQRIGRVIRPYTNPVTGEVKKDAYVVDFQDNMKYLLSHSRKRRKIYSTEEEFEIKDWK